MAIETRPTIYLSNWASHKTPGHHGPGRKWTIMARPRHWERGEGSMYQLTPTENALDNIKWGRWDLPRYREECTRQFKGHQLIPGQLGGLTASGWVDASDGDTLCCACSRAKAAKGECHRVWAAELLHEAGWRVVLDGK